MNKERENIKFVTLETFSSLWTAEVVKTRLLEEGIRVHIINAHVNFSLDQLYWKDFVYRSNKLSS